MKITGLTRVRNEEDIFWHCLESVADVCNGGVYVYDDASTDRTPEIYRSHPAVRGWLRNEDWRDDPGGRRIAEGAYRQSIYDLARKDSELEWVFYFDGDEIFSSRLRHAMELMDKRKLDRRPISGIKLRLFDFYITPDDCDKHWTMRQMIGPEYRWILMLWRDNPRVEFIEREPLLNDPHAKVIQAGGPAWDVAHYGKAISIEQFEQACQYYIHNLGSDDDYGRLFRDKWQKRVGKAVHRVSDFGRPLVDWSQRHLHAVELKAKEAWK